MKVRDLQCALRLSQNSSWKATRRNHPCPSICRSSSAPEAAVEGAILNGFRNVAYGYAGLCVEISNGASDFQYAVVGSRTQTLLLHSPLQKPLGFRRELTIGADLTGVHLRISEDPVLEEALIL